MASDDTPAGAKSPAKSEYSSASLSPSPLHHRKGVVSRLWRGLFGGAGDDYEKILQQLSREEAVVLSRLKRRSRSSKTNTRNVIVISIALEVAAVSYAIMTTRELNLSWQLRAVRVLPMFAIPALSAAVYSMLTSLTRIFDSRDQHTLERLRAERQVKIDELKERTKYYSTQQLIQKYDIDPAAKAAAATVLASKLGSDSGLKVYLGEESNLNGSSDKSFDLDTAQPTGLRQRRPLHDRGHRIETNASQFIDGTSNVYDDAEESNLSGHGIERLKSSHPNDGGWLARMAALLVGEDPTQCYALICSHCYMHNGLVKREDFDYITYYCPHCHALNGSRHSEEHEVGLISEKETSSSMDVNSSYHEHKPNSPVASAAASDVTIANELPEDKAEEELDKFAT